MWVKENPCPSGWRMVWYARQLDGWSKVSREANPKLLQFPTGLRLSSGVSHRGGRRAESGGQHQRLSWPGQPQPALPSLAQLQRTAGQLPLLKVLPSKSTMEDRIALIIKGVGSRDKWKEK